MMKFERTNRFKKPYKKLDNQSQKIINQSLVILANDYSHPSLRSKKMRSHRHPAIWEASANMDLRITFEFQKPDTLVLRNCGHHDQTLKNP